MDLTWKILRGGSLAPMHQAQAVDRDSVHLPKYEDRA